MVAYSSSGSPETFCIVLTTPIRAREAGLKQPLTGVIFEQCGSSATDAIVRSCPVSSVVRPAACMGHSLFVSQKPINAGFGNEGPPHKTVRCR
jgi:hypothetical protein